MRSLLIISVLLIGCNTAGCQVSKKVDSYESARDVAEGDYTEKNKTEAFKYLADLASNGNTQAQVFIGCEYLMGVRVDKNVELGLEYLEAGASRGETNALFCLTGHYYRENMFKEYIASLEKCMELGDLACKIELGSFLLDGRSLSFNYYGSTRLVDIIDVERAIKYLEEASEEGGSSASYILGREYYRGKKVDKDYDKAKYYLKKSMEDPYSTTFDMAREYLNKIEGN